MKFAESMNHAKRMARCMLQHVGAAARGALHVAGVCLSYSHIQAMFEPEEIAGAVPVTIKAFSYTCIQLH
jgi:hypothetical protein